MHSAKCSQCFIKRRHSECLLTMFLRTRAPNSILYWLTLGGCAAAHWEGLTPTTNGALSPWLLNFSMTLHPSGQITPKRWQFLECSLENTGLNTNSGSPAANGQKSFLTYLDICQGKLCKRGDFVRVWPCANSRGAVDILPPSWPEHRVDVISVHTEGRESVFHSSSCFWTPKFPCFYYRWKNFANPVTCDQFGGTVV